MSGKQIEGDRLADLQRAMQAINDAVAGLPDECRDLAGNALLDVAAEPVARDVGCAEAGRIFGRLSELLLQGMQPPANDTIALSRLDGERRTPCNRSIARL